VSTVPLAPTAPTSFLALEEAYARWAPVYDRYPNPLLALEQRYLMPLLPAAANRALDLACGTGRWMELLSNGNVAEVIGLDLSPAMLNVAAQKRSCVFGHLVRGDCLRLPFRACSFDLIICSFAVEHMVNLKNMAGELARVAMPGCEVFITELHPEAHSQGWRTAFRDDKGAVQVEASPHSGLRITEAFRTEGFETRGMFDCAISNQERSIFVRTGKEHIFEEVCRTPAVLIAHFKTSTATKQVEVGP
jgi:SAM-dependent methyltransferase